MHDLNLALDAVLLGIRGPYQCEAEDDNNHSGNGQNACPNYIFNC